jgi:hypothetical protein
MRGDKRAIMAVANTILTIGYHMLQRGTTYQELGADYFDKRNILRTSRRLVKRLEALGHTVILESTHQRSLLQPNARLAYFQGRPVHELTCFVPRLVLPCRPGFT